jgi:pyruvate kinase
VYDGADAVMLSAETAAGQYPREAVIMMDRIATRVEQDSGWRALVEARRPAPDHNNADAITAAARQVAHTVAAAAIVTYSTTGGTTLRCARERPEAPVIGATSRLETARRMAVIWGVHAVETPEVHSMTEMVTRACRVAATEGFAKVGETIVVTAGTPFGTPGATNSLRIAQIP